MPSDRPGFMDEMAAVFRQGRTDLADAVLRALPDSMHLSREPGAPDMPIQQPQPEPDFQSVLAEYAARGQGKEQAERGQELER